MHNRNTPIYWSNKSAKFFSSWNNFLCLKCEMFRFLMYNPVALDSTTGQCGEPNSGDKVVDDYIRE